MLISSPMNTPASNSRKASARKKRGPGQGLVHVYAVRFNERGVGIVARCAAACGLDVASWIRMAALGAAKEQERVTKKSAAR